MIKVRFKKFLLIFFKSLSYPVKACLKSIFLELENQSKQSDMTVSDLEAFRASFKGEIRIDRASRLMYATDASIYREEPLAVAYPRNSDDIRLLLSLASRLECGIIPRAAGTSLAGQVVGSGIVADLSLHFKKVIEINLKIAYKEYNIKTADTVVITIELPGVKN